MSVKPPFRWLGGKFALSKKIVDFIPEHKHYVEVFGGSGALLFRKQPSKIETLNDLDSLVFNFFKVLKNNFKEFKRRVLLTPYSREVFYESFDAIKAGIFDDDVDKALKFFVVARQCFGGFSHKRNFGFSISTNQARAYLKAIDNLDAVVDRLLNVNIENRDFRFILNHYDRDYVFFYLDPPYVNSERSDSAYRTDMPDSDHEELVDILLGLKGKVILSGYPNDIYSRLEDNGWHRIDFDHSCQCSSGGRVKFSGSTKIVKEAKPDAKKRIESIWLNFDFDNSRDLF